MMDAGIAFLVAALFISLIADMCDENACRVAAWGVSLVGTAMVIAHVYGGVM